MNMTEKTNEIINQFYKSLEPGKEKLREEYTLQQIKDARPFYKHDNLKLPDLGPVMDDRISKLEKISDDKKRRKEKLLFCLITFILGIIAGLVIAYLKGWFQLK